MNELENKFYLYEDKYYKIQNDYAHTILNEFFKIINDKNVYNNYFFSDDIEGLLFTYISLKKDNHPLLSILENILIKYKFDYHMSIHNGIYYLLENSHDKSNIDANWWPGVSSYECLDKNKSYYSIETKLGKVLVYKASEYLKNDLGSLVFDRKLNGDCYNASYLYINKNPKYKVIVSLLPFFFEGTHFHAYLESDDGILDIASNAFYDDKNIAKNILNERQIIKLSKDEIEHEWENLTKEEKKDKDNKLLTIALKNLK